MSLLPLRCYGTSALRAVLDALARAKSKSKSQRRDPESVCGDDSYPCDEAAQVRYPAVWVGQPGQHPMASYLSQSQQLWLDGAPTDPWTARRPGF
jgi:hypothetical protein